MTISGVSRLRQDGSYSRSEGSRHRWRAGTPASVEHCLTPPDQSSPPFLSPLAKHRQWELRRWLSGYKAGHVCKCEDLSLDPKNPHRESNCIPITLALEKWAVKTGGSLEVLGLGNLAYLMKFQSSESPYLKQRLTVTCLRVFVVVGVFFVCLFFAVTKFCD